MRAARLTLLVALLVAPLLSLGGCAQRGSGHDDWLAEATQRHARADELLDRGDAPGARAELTGAVDLLARRTDADDDRRRMLQDTYYRLAGLDLRAHDPASALLQAERGLTLGGGSDLFVANLLVARGAAHEARGEATAAAADFHAALLINEQLLAERLRSGGDGP
jgi:hypothetical protein